MAEPDDALLAAVVLALTGEPAAVGASGAAVGADGVDPQRVVAHLAAAGWGAERLQELRRAAQAADRPWPFPVPREVLVAAGFARYASTLAAVRALVGIDGLVPSVHQGPRVFGAAEKRLMAEVPPHHGSVG